MRGSTVLVTGSASGVGAATARALAADGWRVVGADRDAAGLERLSEDGVLTESRVVDLASVEAIRESLGDMKVDAVANVAGLGPDARDARTIWAVNLVAPLVIVDLLAPSMPAGGAIVNVASITGEQADDRYADLLAAPLAAGFLDVVGGQLGEETLAYTYSKWGLLAHTERLAVRLAPGVRVNAVSPGIVDTPMGQRSMQYEWTAKTADRIPLGRLGRPDEIAAAVAFLLGDKASYITGSRLVVDGGYVASRRDAHARRLSPTTRV